MHELKASDFPVFFEALYGHEPFPWQTMLVDGIANQRWPKGWPEGVDLPTASGKTACIDVAVFLLAMFEQNGRLPLDSPARRRIFFVVDRRIVVDEAYRRADDLAEKLNNANEGIIKQVANRLRRLAWGDDEANNISMDERLSLVASRLRGGTVKDERWRLNPAQPAIITGTVDQIGSRLLFRSYGSNNLAAPIDAALTANDSLILLDEAHCAQPFMQTARAVQRYAGSDWMETGSVVAPLTFSILSATLPEDVSDVFPGQSERATALNHSLLQQRIDASKPAELVKVADAGERDEKLIAEAVKRAEQLAKPDGRHRIAVMVNRVARASQIAAELRELASGEKPKLDVDVVLMTGRMRPIDRDALVDKWSPLLKAGSDEQPERPVILVTTQCLEVGADFSFDALITECASLDTLRQRFGRLNRLGEHNATDAAVLARKADLTANADDPIYGTALKETWNWLNEQADDEKRFDFGIAAVDGALPEDAEQRAALLKTLGAPSPDAPVMLPAYLDLLCQTAPQPEPVPDVGIFLHGPQRHASEARVVFRADLLDTNEEGWCDAVALLPPLTAEALTLPLWLIQRWLAPQEKPDLGNLSDVENQQSNEASPDATEGRPFVIWRGNQETVISRNPQDVRPNETIVVPALEALTDKLGHAFCHPDDVPLDVVEQAYPKGRKRYVLRLLPAVFSQPGMPSRLIDFEPLKSLIEWAKDDDRESDELDGLLDDLAKYIIEEESDTRIPPRWLQDAAKALRTKNNRQTIERHPAGGLILLGKPDRRYASLDLDFGDMDDELSTIGQSVPLDKHTEHVTTRTDAWARRCLPESLVDPLITAAEHHDLGKADPRWQQVHMHAGQEDLAAVALAQNPPHIYAKSNELPLRGIAFRRAREQANLPRGFRHEMLSMQLAEAVSNGMPDDADLRELVLHMIAAHHGHARPFAPVAFDENLPPVETKDFQLAEEQRKQYVSPHRLDSGVAERFWQLTRRYGWWGLAYLESIIRLADHAASAAEATTSSPKKQEVAR